MLHSIVKRALCLMAASLLVTGCVPPGKPAPRPVGLPKSAPMVAPRESILSIGEIPANTPSVKVAILLPLSGESMSIGNAMLDAANMALYDSYFSVPSNQIKSQIVLLPKDSGNTPADAARVAKQAIEQGATFIIGPLFSQSVNTVAPLAREHNIRMLTFSNNRAIAGNGIYTFGFLPEQQVARVAEYAFLHNLTRVALLAPNDPYGEKIQETLVAAYTQKGGVVAPTELYAPSPANIDAAVSRLATFNNANQDRRFQAIFIADGGYHLKNIIASLKKTNIDLTKIKLLGTGLWDDPEITKIPEMNGAWFSTSPPESYESFERRFTTIYGYKPIRLASLAYDAVTLAVNLTMPTPGTGLNDEALTNPEGFQGLANGLVRLKPDGTSDRKLALMEVTPNGFKVIEAAPKVYEKESDFTASQAVQPEACSGPACQEAAPAGDPAPPPITPVQQTAPASAN